MKPQGNAVRSRVSSGLAASLAAVLAKRILTAWGASVSIRQNKWAVTVTGANGIGTSVFNYWIE